MIARVDRQEFIDQRRRDYQMTSEAWKKLGRPGNWILCEPSEEIFCDDCDAEIRDQVVQLVARRTRAVCNRCVGKYLARSERG